MFSPVNHMIIAINISFTGRNNNDLIPEYFSQLAVTHPQHQFIFIADKGVDVKNISAKNCIHVVAGAAANNPLLLQYRLNYTIPAILRKHKADVLISSNCCSLKTKVPQCLLLTDLSFISHPGIYPGKWLSFFKKHTAKALAKAKSIVAASPFLKQQAKEKYKIADEAIDLMHYGGGESFLPVTWQQKDAVKDKYTEGLEYFLYSGPIDAKQSLTNLLKAFSFFKKRQKSNMQLIIASATAATDKAFIKSLGSYKYRNEVKLLDKLDTATLAQITGSAYALVYPSVYENFAAAIPAALQCNIPVIAGNGNEIKAINGDALIYCNTSDLDDIADKMMLLFKNEDKRNEAIEKGSQFAAQYNRKEAIACLWQAVEKAAAARS